MKAYESANAVALRRRVAKVHAKAKFVGALYLLGALATVAFACLPMLNINGGELGVTNFWTPYQSLFAAEIMWHGLIVATLYAIMLLVVVVNALGCFSKLGWLFTKRSARYVNGYNKNIRAMDQIGEKFSQSFATLISFTVLIWLMHPDAANVALTMYAYVALGVGLFVHFVTGLISGKVSRFKTQNSVGLPEEVKRECGLFVYFVRNVVQIAAIAGILWFFLSNSTMGDTLYSTLTGGSPFAFDWLLVVVILTLEALIYLLTSALIKHAVSAKEYNLLGIEGAGMKKFRGCSFFVFLFSGIIAAIDYFYVIPPVVNFPMIYVAAIAFVAFLFDCIVKSRKKEEVEEEEEYDPLEQMPSQAPVKKRVQQHPTVIYNQVPAQQRPTVIYNQMPMPMPQSAQQVAQQQAAQRAAQQAAHQATQQAVQQAAHQAAQQAAQQVARQAAQQAAQQRPIVIYNQIPAQHPAQQVAAQQVAAQQAAQSSAMQAAQQQRVGVQQPVYVPVYYPSPMPNQETKKAEIVETKPAAVPTAVVAKPAPASAPAAVEAKPAPEHLQPTPAPATVAAKPAPAPVVLPVKVDVKPEPKAKKEFEEVVELNEPLDPNKQWKVRCPRCGKQLSIRETTPYHRCPGCDKVFTFRKFQTYTKNP